MRKVILLDTLTATLLRNTLCEFLSRIENPKHRYNNRLRYQAFRKLQGTKIFSCFLEDIPAVGERYGRIAIRSEELTIYNDYGFIDQPKCPRANISLDKTFAEFSGVDAAYPGFMHHPYPELVAPALDNHLGYFCGKLHIQYANVRPMIDWRKRFMGKDPISKYVYREIFEKIMILYPNSMAFDPSFTLSSVIRKSIIPAIITDDATCSYYNFDTEKYKLLYCFMQFMRAAVYSREAWYRILHY